MINTSRLLRRHIFSIMVFGLALNRAPDAAPEAVIGNVLEGTSKNLTMPQTLLRKTL